MFKEEEKKIPTLNQRRQTMRAASRLHRKSRNSVNVRFTSIRHSVKNLFLKKGGSSSKSQVFEKRNQEVHIEEKSGGELSDRSDLAFRE